MSQFVEHLRRLGISLPIDPEPLSAARESPLARPFKVGSLRVGNRWCIHPMEGWDATDDGKPSERTRRRWQNFAVSGAKLIWGEACAVRRDGRANPNQLYVSPANQGALTQLVEETIATHRERFGKSDDLLIGLQLTHSGRFCRPNRKDRPEPRIVYHHPLLDAKFGIPAEDAVVFSDGQIEQLVGDYAAAARQAQQAGFQFVDLKACHGYLGHEFLSAFDRPGKYGGPLENRSRFLRETIEAVRRECPGLMIAVRMSLFDMPAFRPDPARSAPGRPGPGIPHEFALPYPAFGCDRNDPLRIDLAEPLALLAAMESWGVELVNLTAGSPYYNPHVQRPACFPPSDGYQPPEDPLLGCWRQIDAVRQVKLARPNLPIVGTAYTYFQDFLPQVAQGIIRAGWADFIGIGRMVLSYWDLPADVLEGRPLAHKRICRTFSDCTSAPRGGLPSGCYPLDPYYKRSSEAATLKQLKGRTRPSGQ